MSYASVNKIRCAAWEADQIAKAVMFTAVMFRGFPEGHDRREAPTLAEARQLGKTMLDEYANANYGRSVMIYAVSPTATIFVETQTSV